MEVTGRRSIDQICWEVAVVVFAGGVVAICLAAVLAVCLFLLAEVHCKWSPQTPRCLVEYQRDNPPPAPVRVVEYRDRGEVP